MTATIGAGGAIAASASAATITPVIPTLQGSNNSILVAVCVSKNNGTHATATSGWTKINQTNSGASFTASIWWALQGSANPVFTWTGSVACSAEVFEVKPSADATIDTALIALLGAVGAGTTSTHTSAGGNTGRNDADVIYYDVCAANTAAATPTGWSELFDVGSTTSVTRHVFGQKTVATSGSASGAISITAGNAAWVQWQLQFVATVPPNPSFQVSKADMGAWLSPPSGFAVSLIDIGAWLSPAAGFVVPKIEAGAWISKVAPLVVGGTVPDDTEILAAGATYYRRLIMPYDIEITTVMFEVAGTSATTQITGKLFADNAGAVGALLRSSNPQTGTTADLEDDLPLTANYTAFAGQAVWAAISVAVTNVNGKVKKGGKGQKNTDPAFNGYMIWLTGNAIDQKVPLLAMGTDIALYEGASGTTNFVFDVTRQILTTGTTTVDWAVTGTGANPATAADFTGGVFPSGTVTFNAGDTIQQITVGVVADSTSEPDESFIVTLSNPSGGATIGTATSTGLIYNDDHIPINAANSTFAHAASSSSLVTRSPISPASSTMAHAAISPTLAAHSAVNPANSALAHSLSSPTVTNTGTTAEPDDAQHDHSLSAPSLAAKATIAPASSVLAHLLSSSSLTAKATIAPANDAHAHTLSQPTLGAKSTIAPAAGQLDHSSTSSSLTAASTVAPANLQHADTATSPTLAAHSTVAPASSAFAHALSSPDITPAVVPADSVFANVATSPTLLAHSSIFPDDSLFAHPLTPAAIAIRLRPSEGDPLRRREVPTIDRSGEYPPMIRPGTVPAVDRDGSIAAVDTSAEVPATDRNKGSASSIDRRGEVPEQDREGDI